jgi:Asp-tRNA(Asn)/Glu-tRNA(Gln) amidotransferase A subunit family amidase
MPHRSSLCRMANMVRERKISPVELLDAHFRQITKHNPRPLLRMAIRWDLCTVSP